MTQPAPRARALALSIAAVLQLSIFALPTLAAFTQQGATVLGGANYTTRSASLADYDSDGDLDLMFQTNSGTFLYRNNLFNSGGTASFTFTNVTATMLPSITTQSWSAAWGDYNSDGKVDVMVGLASGTGVLLKNNGGSSPFTNANVDAGLSGSPFQDGFTQNLAWGDFNNDHRLDLVVGMEGPAMHQMYIQQVNGTFLPKGADVGLQVPYGTKSYGLAVGDYDGDGDLDMYLSTCRAGGAMRNNFFKNMLKESGTNTLSFVDIADTNGTGDTNNTYGSQFVDMDNDGDLDLVVTGAQNDTTHISNPTKIYRNNGNDTFTNVDTITGHPLLSDVGTDLNGLKTIDYDNDGDLDLYFHDNLSGTGNQKLYRNDGNWQFSNVTAAMGLSGSATTGAGGYDSAWGDLDRDGDQDLIDVNNSTLSGSATPEKAFINDASTNGNHWLYLKLNGPGWNTTGIGTSIYATLDAGTANQLTLRREANTDANTFNQSDLPVHFGLAAADHVDWLRVVWADGTVQFLHNVTANQNLTISYASALPGDFSGDGVVDTADYTIWRDNLGAPFTADDYNTWRANFGRTFAAAAAAVPEPNILCIFALAALAIVRTHYR